VTEIKRQRLLRSIAAAVVFAFSVSFEGGALAGWNCIGTQKEKPGVVNFWKVGVDA
jgi:hypothetical protein